MPESVVDVQILPPDMKLPRFGPILAVATLLWTASSGWAADSATSTNRTFISIPEFPSHGSTPDPAFASATAETIDRIREQALAGDPTAQTVLGYCHFFGEANLPQSFDEAMVWLRRAAESGDVISQFNVALAYARGRSDMTKAAPWYQKSAALGHVKAQRSLADCLFNGIGVTANFYEAAKWYRQAANQGDAEAQYGLGRCYATGRGAPFDLVEAYKWLSVAANGGYVVARSYQADIIRRMAPLQISEALRLAREFKPQIPKVRRGTRGQATAFAISADGYMVTSEHVVRDARLIQIIVSTGAVTAKVIKADATSDLALLKIDGQFSPLAVVPSRTVRLGATVSTVGFPNAAMQGKAPKLAKGEIGSLAGIQDDPRYFQISAPIQPGNSGGALVDENGNVVGVVEAKLNFAVALATTRNLPENVNYAVKSTYLLGLLESVPDANSRLVRPNDGPLRFEDVVAISERASFMVTVE